MIRKETRDKIIAQALNEISFARQYKQGKISNWQKNEEAYYGRKPHSDTSRANVELGRMQEFIHTILAKIDEPLIFKFVKRKDAQMKRVEQLNSLRRYDAYRDNWDIMDIVGKKQALLYGRAIYSYHADSIDGYKPHLENVDVYDFLIDPAGGGIDIDNAYYMGRYGVVKNKADLKRGVKEGYYLRYETQNLIDGHGNSTEKPQEETNKQNRTRDTNTYTTDKEISDPDKYVFWEWYTTFEGERYYLCLQERAGTAIRVEKLTDVFASDMWPIWTWACFPDLTEFWTPSYADYVREIFMAQSVSINQMLDNAEQINKPQKVVNVGAIENLAELKYRRDGYIRVKQQFNADAALQTIKVPSIDTPIKVYQLLDTIQEKASGVTAASKGIAEEDKVGIYEGNQANTADRFGYLSKSYAFGYKRFAKLWEAGVREHLVKKVAIDILGPNGVEVQEVTKRDLFRKDEEYSVIVEASNAELNLSLGEKRVKLQFLQANAGNPIINQKKATEIQATIVGFTEEDIRQLMDTSDFGDAGLMSEAERDIEEILDGKNRKPNQAATTAYKQRFVDYMQDNEEHLSLDQFNRLADYVRSLDEVIVRNMVRQVNEKKMLMQLGEGMTEEMTGQATEELDLAEDNNLTATAPTGEVLEVV